MSDVILPIEAMELINQPGTRTGVMESGEYSFSDGDILIRFHLADGRTLDYCALHESDYYGGHYDHIQWRISGMAPMTTDRISIDSERAKR